MNRSRIAAATLFALSLVFASACGAQPLAVPAPPRASIEQRIGVTLPLDVRAMDSSGVSHRLRDYFGDGEPVLLVAGYYRCPELCGLLMHGLLDALQESGVPRTRWRIVRFTIDPHETPSDARSRREIDLAYADSLLGAEVPERTLDLQLLTLPPADAARLEHSIGYRFEPLHATADSDARFAHPASVVLVTPEGRVSRYFNGVQFDPAELRVALADAEGDRLGSVTSRLALLCAHFDPRVGRYSESVMNGLRVLCIALVLGLGAWCWKRLHGGMQ